MNIRPFFELRKSALSVAMVLGTCVAGTSHASVTFTLDVAGVQSITGTLVNAGDQSSSVFATVPGDTLTTATLLWSGDADLDLFAVTPNGIVSFDNAVFFGGSGSAVHGGDDGGGEGDHSEVITFAGDIDSGTYEFFARAFAINTPEAQEEANEEATSQVTEVQVSNIATNVTTRVRTAFRAISFTPPPAPGPAPSPGGAPGGSPGGAPGGSPGDTGTPGGTPGGGGGLDGGQPEAGLLHGIHTTGRAAGGSGSPVGVWVAPSYTSFDSSTGSGHNGKTLSLGVGADKLVGDNMVVGLAASVERTRTDMQGVLAGNSLEVDGVSAVAYAGRQLQNGMLIDGFIGYGLLENTTEQAGNKATYDSRRFVAGGTLSRQVAFGSKFDATFSGGLTYSNESFDSYTLGITNIASTETSLTALNLEAEVAGRLDGNVYPYAVLGLEQQLDNSSGDEETSVVFGGGVSILPRENVMVDFSLLGREAEENSSVTGSASVRVTFL